MPPSPSPSSQPSSSSSSSSASSASSSHGSATTGKKKAGKKKAGKRSKVVLVVDRSEKESADPVLVPVQHSRRDDDDADRDEPNKKRPLGSGDNTATTTKKVHTFSETGLDSPFAFHCNLPLLPSSTHSDNPSLVRADSRYADDGFVSSTLFAGTASLPETEPEIEPETEPETELPITDEDNNPLKPVHIPLPPSCSTPTVTGFVPKLEAVAEESFSVHLDFNMHLPKDTFAAIDNNHIQHAREDHFSTAGLAVSDELITNSATDTQTNTTSKQSSPLMPPYFTRHIFAPLLRRLRTEHAALRTSYPLLYRAAQTLLLLFILPFALWVFFFCILPLAACGWVLFGTGGVQASLGVAGRVWGELLDAEDL
ncbi:hypothetical protein BC830DRAFT_1231711 [Chytriomyces sp. MP71]|nr:hypothetical protein BC830DRAFT_1231711 [Chytriomyces sp. MP71]